MELVGQVTSERLEDETSVVSVAGWLDLYTVPQLEPALLTVDGAGSVVVDLSQCTFVDATSLGVLLVAKRRLAAKAKFSIVVSLPETRRTFELTGLDRKRTLQPSLTAVPNGRTR